jgi:predicted nucleic acid-binding protein
MTEMARWVYCDASALIKRYAPESGTALINAAFDRAYPDRMTCATLGLLEVVSILTRKRNDGRLTQAAYDQALIEVRAELIERQEFRLSPITDALLFEALTLIVQHNVNATDALILRSALDVQQTVQTAGDEVVLWSADKRLVRAAQREGLATFDPETDTVDDFEALFGAV